jgi:hypothetical protein
MVGGAPQGEGLELSLRDHDGQHRIDEKRLTYSGREIKHVGSARRAEVFPFGLETAGGIVLPLAPQPIHPTRSHTMALTYEP